MTDLNTQLCYAAEQGRVDAVLNLLRQGADIHAYDDGALRWASRDGQIEVVRVLIAHGADLTHRSFMALTKACFNGHYSVAQLLLDSGAVDISGKALMGACTNGHEPIVRLLLRRGVTNINADQSFALRIAAKHGFVRIVQLLLQYGADYTAYNYGARRWATIYKHRDVSMILRQVEQNIH